MYNSPKYDGLHTVVNQAPENVFPKYILHDKKVFCLNFKRVSYASSELSSFRPQAGNLQI